MKTNTRPVAFVSEQRGLDCMEDRHTFTRNFIQEGWIFGGVYDGHGSKEPAEVAAEIIPGLFRESVKTLSVDQAFKKTYRVASDEMLVKANFGGTCAANFFIIENEIHHANVGDSRIIVIGKDMVELTTNHRVENDDERARIVAAGGKIKGRYVVSDSGRWLMPTRTLGDLIFRSVGVTYEPSVGSYNIQPTDNWLVAGTDGLFDVIGLDEIWGISRKVEHSEKLATDLMDEVHMRSGEDNITIIVLKLN
jgi:serine/threonine protein phosphatase PrpC